MIRMCRLVPAQITIYTFYLSSVNFKAKYLCKYLVETYSTLYILYYKRKAYEKYYYNIIIIFISIVNFTANPIKE